MPGGSKKGGGLKTKKSAFYLKSGNSPLFKEMGGSPVKGADATLVEGARRMYAAEAAGKGAFIKAAAPGLLKGVTGLVKGTIGAPEEVKAARKEKRIAMRGLRKEKRELKKGLGLEKRETKKGMFKGYKWSKAFGGEPTKEATAKAGGEFGETKTANVGEEKITYDVDKTYKTKKDIKQAKQEAKYKIKRKKRLAVEAGFAAHQTSTKGKSINVANVNAQVNKLIESGWSSKEARKFVAQSMTGKSN